MHIGKWIMRAEAVWIEAIQYGWSFKQIVESDRELFHNWPLAIIHLQAGAPCPPGIKPGNNMKNLIKLQKKHRRNLEQYEILKMAFEEIKQLQILAAEGRLNFDAEFYFNLEAVDILNTPNVTLALPFLKIGGHHFPRKPYYIVHLALKFHICYYAALTMYCKLLEKSTVKML